jgi:hypothetical protein
VLDKEIAPCAQPFQAVEVGQHRFLATDDGVGPRTPA